MSCPQVAARSASRLGGDPAGRPAAFPPRSGLSGQPHLLPPVGGRRTSEVAELRFELVTRQLEQVPHLVAVGPAKTEDLFLLADHPTVAVCLCESPSLLEHLRQRVVVPRRNIDPNLVPAHRAANTAAIRARV